ncbi:MAG: hypothetical protein MRY83_15420, partial [Flavobacteriales bacterium]|nr:hypothetical protein [Flavobacteriales bacterium]
MKAPILHYIIIAFLIFLFQSVIHAQQINSNIFTPTKDLFIEKIHYNTLSNQNPNPQNNGNIGAVEWNIGDNKHQYQYTYDNKNQLKSAQFFQETPTGYQMSDLNSTQNIDYDENGNITGVLRSGIGQPKDQLNYTYNTSNQLQTVEELGDLNSGFTTNNAFGGYLYDDNGNMIHDDHKEISIRYNNLNLPDTIVFSSNDTIIFFYNSKGKKYLKKAIGHTGSVDYKYYINDIHYSSGTIESIAHDEGRVVPSNLDFQYEYVLKDHLGNNRVFFSDLNHDGSIDKNTEILQQHHYYPFGMKMEGSWNQITSSTNPNQFNDKENIEDFGLNWLDYDARFYDPS